MRRNRRSGFRNCDLGEETFCNFEYNSSVTMIFFAMDTD